MLYGLTKRVLTETRPKVVAKFVYNFGVKGVRSVELHKRRRRRGVNFPPFLFISVISSCQLRCQGCWVDVASPAQKLSLDELNAIVNDAKAHGNAYFGILGGEPFLHPQLLDLFAAHPDCYFQVFTNGQLITDDVARELARLGNVTPLISIEGSEVVSDERRGRMQVLSKTLRRARDVPPAWPVDRGRDERLPDQHRPRVRGVAAPPDRDGRALRLVPHLPRRRPQAEPAAGADPRPGAGRSAASSSRCGRGCRSRSSMPTGTIAAKRCVRWLPASAITSDLAATSNRVR